MANSWQDFAAQYMPQGSGAWGATPANPNQAQQDWAKNAGAMENQWNQITFGGGRAPNMNADANIGKSFDQIQAEQAAWEAQRNNGYQGLASQITGQPVQSSTPNPYTPTQVSSVQANPYLTPQPAPVAQPVPAQPASTGAMQSPQSGMPNNPYLPQIGNALTAQSNQNLFQNVLPQIGRNSVATGGYGGSRQGVAEGVAMGNAQTGLDSALAQMYGGAWNNDQNLAQQRYSTDVGANTAKYGYDTNAATSRYGSDSSSQIQNRNIDLSANQQGFNQYLASLNAQLGLGTGQSQVGQEQMDASKAPLNTYSNLVNPYTGLGGTKTTTDPATGGGAAGALGGAMTAAQLYDLIFNGKKP